MQVDEREQELKKWLEKVLGKSDFSCEPASSDASFRRYFRVQTGLDTFVVMDAPPDKEDCVPFVNIAELLQLYGVQTPIIHHKNMQQGFLVLSDFGVQCYLDVICEDNAASLYADAASVLHRLHDVPTDKPSVQLYSEHLLKQEMRLFQEWFLEGLLELTLNKSDQEVLNKAQSQLALSAAEQPQVFVHRDYHSRNLMVTKENNPGVIDFQDAVIGPITYDLVSLYRDCYIAWPDESIYSWLTEFLLARERAGIKDDFSTQQFYQWFDWMGVQRHMKAIGIFSRLLLRDGKSGYVADIPRTLKYVIKVCERYPELESVKSLIVKNGVVEQLERVLADHDNK